MGKFATASPLRAFLVFLFLFVPFLFVFVVGRGSEVKHGDIQPVDVQNRRQVARAHRQRQRVRRLYQSPDISRTRAPPFPASPLRA